VDVERLLSEDRQRVWHPYAPMPALVPPLPIVAAEGCACASPTGVSSSTACRRGGRPCTATPPVLDAAVRDQLGADEPRDVRRPHPRARRRPGPTLVEITPAGLEHVFLADSGSVSVEVAIKMCLQYQRSRGRRASTG
jgi:adenosylmethionine-8-amino-7-oxononanoate aminotransferase